MCCPSGEWRRADGDSTAIVYEWLPMVSGGAAAHGAPEGGARGGRCCYLYIPF
jgi:hypothetical protein